MMRMEDLDVEFSDQLLKVLNENRLRTTSLRFAAGGGASITIQRFGGMIRGNCVVEIKHDNVRVLRYFLFRKIFMFEFEYCKNNLYESARKVVENCLSVGR